MKTIQEHRDKVKEIVELAFGHAVNHFGAESLQKLAEQGRPESSRREFVVKVHDGFKLAQKLLIEEVLYYQPLLRSKTEESKEARRQRNKELEAETNHKLAIIKQRLATMAHIADGIAWQLLGAQIHVARRLYMKDTARKFLDSSNIEHAVKVADEFNSNPESFALLSDLTGFVQIGDLVVAHEGRVGLMELKEGAVNDQVAAYLATLDKGEETLDESVLQQQFTPKTVQQIKRVVRQKQRTTRAINVIKNDKGIDPATGQNITVETPSIPTIGYQDELERLHLELEKKNWAYGIVDVCLHIGIYKDKAIPMALFVIKELLARKTENYIVIDWLSITENVSEPIFSKPLAPEFIVDVLTGAVKVIIGINFDALIELFNSLGLETKWLSEKETTRWEQKTPSRKIFKVKKRAIVVKLDEHRDVILDGGSISKMLFDNIRPSNVAMSIATIQYKSKDDSSEEQQTNE